MHNDTKKEEGIAWNARNKKIPRMSSRSKMVRIHPSYETSHDPCTHLESRRRRWNEIDTDASFLSPLARKENLSFSNHTPHSYGSGSHILFFFLFGIGFLLGVSIPYPHPWKERYRGMKGWFDWKKKKKKRFVLFGFRWNKNRDHIRPSFREISFG